MILVDANILIYAVSGDAPLNGKAKSWLESVLSGPLTVGFSWNVLLAFLRLVTRPSLFARPLAADEGFDLPASWLSLPPVTIVHPGPNHLRILRQLLKPLGIAGNLTSDAHLAAMAIEHDAKLCSSDNDFAGFNGLKCRNSLS